MNKCLACLVHPEYGCYYCDQIWCGDCWVKCATSRIWPECKVANYTLIPGHGGHYTMGPPFDSAHKSECMHPPEEMEKYLRKK